jgi:hypothetical protein
VTWQEVASSELRAVRYDDKALVLEIHFRNNHVYQYAQVPASIYEGLMAAESKGRFFNALIRNKYPHHRLI